MKYSIPLILIMLLYAFPIQAADDEKEIRSKISKVTVFTNQAQIERNANPKLPTGDYLLKFTGLSPFIKGQSVQVKGKGNFTIMSVRYKKNPAVRKKFPQKMQSLQDKIDKIKDHIQDEQTWLNVLNEEEKYVKTNTEMINEQELAEPGQVKTMHSFFREKIKKLRFEKLKRNRKIKELRDSVRNIQNRISALNRKKEDPSGEILLEVHVSSYTRAEFTLSYIVSNAGWYPAYDLRVKDIDSPVELNYKANIFQSTGIQWENTEITLSNAHPQVSGDMPALTPYYITRGVPHRQNRFSNVNKAYNPAIRHVSGYVRNSRSGEPIPYANVRAGSERTTTNKNGYYSINIPNNTRNIQYRYAGYNRVSLNVYSSQINAFMRPARVQLEAAKVQSATMNESAGIEDFRTPGKKEEPKARTPSARVTQQQTSIEFELSGRHNVDNSGKSKTIAFHTEKIDAMYEYQCVPKLNEHGYLFARLSNWEDLDLVSGKANIYFENTYVGETHLDINQMQDTIQISLGQDQNIIVSRKKLKDRSKKQILGKHVKVARKYELSIRNNKASDIKMKIYDQVPVSRINEVEVDIEETSGGKLNENNGILSWKLNMDSRTTRKLELSYEVKHPKSMKLNIE